MDAGRYEVVVYAARTRRMLRERTMVGQVATCPSEAPEELEVLHTTLSSTQLLDAFSDIVGG